MEPYDTPTPQLIESSGAKFTTRINRKDTLNLGVEDELRRYAMNEYLTQGSRINYVGDPRVGLVAPRGEPDQKDSDGDGRDVDYPDEDDEFQDELLLTNAITENKVQDDLDKTRYLKETKSYITINSSLVTFCQSSLPDQKLLSGQRGDMTSLHTSGDQLANHHTFAPFAWDVDAKTGETKVIINRLNNQVVVKLCDITELASPTIVVGRDSKSEFTTTLTSGSYTLVELSQVIQNHLNRVLTGANLTNSPDPMHMFIVECVVDQHMNPDRVTINIRTQANYIFTLRFAQISTGDRKVEVKSTGASLAPKCYNANNYKIQLHEVYNNVKAIRVIASEIPNSDTIINIYNNHVVFNIRDAGSLDVKTSDGSNDWHIYIPPGNYTPITLASTIELEANNYVFGETGIANMFTVSADLQTQTFTIVVNPAGYTFKWNFIVNEKLRWRNLYCMLGFKYANTGYFTNNFDNLLTVNLGTSGAPNYVKLPYAHFNLKKPTCVWMYLNNYETITDHLNARKYFSRLAIDNTDDDDVYSYNTFAPLVHVFVDSPLPVLSTFDIQFYDELGFPYLFNGLDHSITLEITHHRDLLMGTNISSRRGIADKTSYI